MIQSLDNYAANISDGVRPLTDAKHQSVDDSMSDVQHMKLGD